LNTPLIPWWFVAPVATVALLMLTAHLLALNAAAVEPRRKRIRSANNVLMMVLTPLLAYGFGVVRPSEARMFVLVWTVIPALLLMVIMLALADALHSVRLHRESRRSLRATFRAGQRGPGDPA
jgi:hypothetical protein